LLVCTGFAFEWVRRFEKWQTYKQAEKEKKESTVLEVLSTKDSGREEKKSEAPSLMERTK